MVKLQLDNVQHSACLLWIPLFVVLMLHIHTTKAVPLDQTPHYATADGQPQQDVTDKETSYSPFKASAPGPEPGLAPGPEPGLTPGPEPGLAPGPEPGLTPGPEPGLIPGPEPGLTPGPEPGLTPGPEPGLTPGPEPGLAPGPEPGLAPGPEPGLTRNQADNEEQRIDMPASDPIVPPTKYDDSLTVDNARFKDHGNYKHANVKDGHNKEQNDMKGHKIGYSDDAGFKNTKKKKSRVMEKTSFKDQSKRDNYKSGRTTSSRSLGKYLAQWLLSQNNAADTRNENGQILHRQIDARNDEQTRVSNHFDKQFKTTRKFHEKRNVNEAQYRYDEIFPGDIDDAYTGTEDRIYYYYYDSDIGDDKSYPPWVSKSDRYNDIDKHNSPTDNDISVDDNGFLMGQKVGSKTKPMKNYNRDRKLLKQNKLRDEKVNRLVTLLPKTQNEAAQYDSFDNNNHPDISIEKTIKSEDTDLKLADDEKRNENEKRGKLNKASPVRPIGVKETQSSPPPSPPSMKTVRNHLSMITENIDDGGGDDNENVYMNVKNQVWDYHGVKPDISPYSPSVGDLASNVSSSEPSTEGQEESSDTNDGKTGSASLSDISRASSIDNGNDDDDDEHNNNDSRDESNQEREDKLKNDEYKMDMILPKQTRSGISTSASNYNSNSNSNASLLTVEQDPSHSQEEASSVLSFTDSNKNKDSNDVRQREDLPMNNTSNALEPIRGQDFSHHSDLVVSRKDDADNKLDTANTNAQDSFVGTHNTSFKKQSDDGQNVGQKVETENSEYNPSRHSIEMNNTIANKANPSNYSKIIISDENETMSQSQTQQEDKLNSTKVLTTNGTTNRLSSTNVTRQLIATEQDTLHQPGGNTTSSYQEYVNSSQKTESLSKFKPFKNETSSVHSNFPGVSNVSYLNDLENSATAAISPEPTTSTPEGQTDVNNTERNVVSTESTLLIINKEKHGGTSNPLASNNSRHIEILSERHAGKNSDIDNRQPIDSFLKSLQEDSGVSNVTDNIQFIPNRQDIMRDKSLENLTDSKLSHDESNLIQSPDVVNDGQVFVIQNNKTFNSPTTNDFQNANLESNRVDITETSLSHIISNDHISNLVKNFSSSHDENHRDDTVSDTPGKNVKETIDWEPRRRGNASSIPKQYNNTFTPSNEQQNKMDTALEETKINEPPLTAVIDDSSVATHNTNNSRRRQNVDTPTDKNKNKLNLIPNTKESRTSNSNSSTESTGKILSVTDSESATDVSDPTMGVGFSDRQLDGRLKRPPSTRAPHHHQQLHRLTLEDFPSLMLRRRTSPIAVRDKIVGGKMYISDTSNGDREVPRISTYMAQDFSLRKPEEWQLKSLASPQREEAERTSSNRHPTRENVTRERNGTTPEEADTGSGKTFADFFVPQPPMARARAAVSAVLTSHFGPTKQQIIPFDLELLGNTARAILHNAPGGISPTPRRGHGKYLSYDPDPGRLGGSLRNLADNYDNSTGMFIATIPGTYVISVYLMSHPGAKVNARVYVNDRPVAALWADDTAHAGFYPSSSIQTIAQLGFGDQIYVMLVDGGYGDSWVHANYNVFTVFLLYEETFS